MADNKKKISKYELRQILGVFRYVLRYKTTFITGLFFLSLSSSFFMAFPYVTGKLLDIASGESDFFIRDLNTAALLLVGILAIQSVFSFLRVVFFARVSEYAMADLRTDLFGRISQLPMAFFDQTRVGELSSRLSNDVSTIQDTFSQTLAEFIRQIIILIVGLTLIFFTTTSLSLFMLGVFPLVIVSALFFGKFIRSLSKQTQEKLAQANVVAEESMQLIQTVKAFTAEVFQQNRYGKAIKDVVNTALRVATYRAAFISFIIFGLFGAMVAIMWYGAVLVKSGQMSVGDMVSFVLFTMFIGASIAGLGDLFGQVQRAAGASSRILELLDTPTEPSGSIQTENLRAPIHFQNIHFAYPTRPEIDVLKDISFTILPGEKVALVGHSGAGKSTIAQLIMRFYDVKSGQILIGDRNINDFNVQSLRQKIGIVPQEVILFGGNLEENIRFGRPDAMFTEIHEAARKANAMSFIDTFPDGFNTIVGERGMKLSGGQRQRIAIARAILKNPDILILDEATSALDAASEQLIQQAMETLMQDRTTIIIAHRLSTIKSADKIIVLKDGQIIETGTHASLIDQKGEYRRFIDLQQLS